MAWSVRAPRPMNASSTIDELGREIGVSETEPAPHWFERVVRWRMRRSVARARERLRAGAYAHATPTDRARSLVRLACVKAAVTGALSGAACSAAEIVTTETDGMAALVTIPAAGATIAGELFLRGIVHVDLACELAEVFGIGLSVDERDVVRLFSIVFGGAKPTPEGGEDLGRGLVEEVTTGRADDIVERAGHAIVGESVLRNLLPFVGIVTSAVTNAVVTYRLGAVLRRTFRYERALVETLRAAEAEWAPLLPLLVEGLWFVFTADGRLTPEEAACLAQRLDDLPEHEREKVLARFTLDESDWLSRLGEVPEASRDAFLRVLVVAVALDKSVMLPETKILGRAAKALGRAYDPTRLKRIVEVLDRTGTLDGAPVMDRSTP